MRGAGFRPPPSLFWAGSFLCWLLRFNEARQLDGESHCSYGFNSSHIFVAIMRCSATSRIRCL